MQLTLRGADHLQSFSELLVYKGKGDKTSLSLEESVTGTNTRMVIFSFLVEVYNCIVLTISRQRDGKVMNQKPNH